jgi:hypothetical protein
MELETGLKALCETLGVELPTPDSKQRYVFEFADGITLRCFSLPGRHIVFEGLVCAAPRDGREAEALCKSLLQTSLALCKTTQGEIILDTEKGEICFTRQFLPGHDEGLVFGEEIDDFLNELEFVRNQAKPERSGGRSPSSPFSLLMR